MMRMVPLFIALAATTTFSLPSLATTNYRIMYGGSDVSQSTPLIRNEVWPLNAGPSATCTFTGRGHAYPGQVGLFDRMDITWTGGGGAYLECLLISETNEFIISGPPGPPVAGTLHLKYQANFARQAWLRRQWRTRWRHSDPRHRERLRRDRGLLGWQRGHHDGLRDLHRTLRRRD